MGRLSKIKLELIQEANKRLLGEDVETVIPNFKATELEGYIKTTLLLVNKRKTFWIRTIYLS